jgi:hypothetical protein
MDRTLSTTAVAAIIGLAMSEIVEVAGLAARVAIDL